MQTNALYYGENLDFLRDRKHLPIESVDLIYLDPPFNSNRDYNVIFKDESGRRSDAQIVAFEDTWHWGLSAEDKLSYLTTTHRHRGSVPDAVGRLIDALVTGMGKNQMMAYLVEMTARLVEMHCVLKTTGSLYLHCDPRASHYLKAVLDAIFQPQNFLSEVVWKRTGTHSSANRWGPVHDIILAYAKCAGRHVWNRPYVAHDEGHQKRHYRAADASGRVFTHGELTAPGTRNGRSGLPWRGFDVTAIGRHWSTTVEGLDDLDLRGRIYFPEDGGWPRLIRYQDESKGRAVGDVWSDIAPLNMKAKERLGYPTQKPLALLERIIEASSNLGDVVLDPFCGCGTAIVAAHKLGRRWIGIDVTYLAIPIMRNRLRDSFGLTDVTVVNRPREIGWAHQAVRTSEGRYEFQWWALDLVGAMPMGGARKKGADRGIDGLITFPDRLGKMETVVVSVKGGAKVSSPMVRDLRGVMERDGAAIGLFVSLEEPTREMRLEAEGRIVHGCSRARLSETPNVDDR